VFEVRDADRVAKGKLVTRDPAVLKRAIDQLPNLVAIQGLARFEDHRDGWVEED
jgi:hypothetical protein